MSTTIQDQPGPDGGLEFELERARLRADRAELQLERLQQSRERTKVVFQLLQQALQGLRVAMTIAALWLPLTALRPIVRDITAATNVHIGGFGYISLALSALVALGWISSGIQSRLRKKKIKEQRERLDRLELQLFQQRANPEEV